jgi:hypothetical protein
VDLEERVPKEAVTEPGASHNSPKRSLSGPSTWASDRKRQGRAHAWLGSLAWLLSGDDLRRLAGANLDGGDPELLLSGLQRAIRFLTPGQRERFARAVFQAEAA